MGSFQFLRFGRHLMEQRVRNEIASKTLSFAKTDSVSKRFLCTSDRFNAGLATASNRSPAGASFRTQKMNPLEHTRNNLGQFYQIPDEDFLRLFHVGTLSTDYMRRRKAFLEATLMVREPALTVMETLKIDSIYQNPAPKFVLYGEKGAGKTSTLCHILHFAARASNPDWQLIYISWPHDWAAKPKSSDAIPSGHKEGRLDTPKQAVELLSVYKRINQTLLDKHQPKVANGYTWNLRESTAPGESISDLVDFGIARPKYACDVVGALLKETREQAGTWPFRTMLAVDGANAFGQPTRTLKEEPLIFWHMRDLSLVHNVEKTLQGDWTNGVVVATVDQLATYEPAPLCLPRALLGAETFERLSPCVPVRVGPLSEREMSAFVNYASDRRWIHPTRLGSDQGRKEIEFLSGNNPEQFYEVVKFM